MAQIVANNRRRATCRRLRTIIRADANAQAEYRTKEGNTCVIGGMAVAAKIPLPTKYNNENSIYIEPSDNSQVAMKRFQRRLLRAYPGLTDVNLQRLQYVNDHYTGTPARRRALLRLLDKIEASA